MVERRTSGFVFHGRRATALTAAMDPDEASKPIIIFDRGKEASGLRREIRTEHLAEAKILWEMLPNPVPRSDESP